MVPRYEEDFKKCSPVEINGESISADGLKKLRKELAILK